MKQITIKPLKYHLETVSVKAVYIRRAEGSMTDTLPSHYEWMEFSSIEAANKHLEWWKFTYADLGGDKHDFKIVWNDDSEYSGCLSCMSPYNKYYRPEVNRVNDHIKEHLEWMINEGARTGYISENDIQNAKLLLDKYEL